MGAGQNWDQLQQQLLNVLNREKQLHLETASVDTTHGGEQAEPSPVDRRKPGTKFAVLVDWMSVPLVIRAIPAIRSDHCEIQPGEAASLYLAGRPGRPRTHPQSCLPTPASTPQPRELCFVG